MARFKIAFLPLAGAVLCLVATGCGKSTPASSGGDDTLAKLVAAKKVVSPNACTVLSEALAKKYLGDGAKQRQNRQQNPQMSLCQYGSDKGVITVDVGPWAMINTPTAQDKPVAGIGDEAHTGGGALYVRKGEVGMTVDVTVMSGEFWGKAADDENAKTEAAEKKVAPDLVANL
jgi:hypothetical protein